MKVYFISGNKNKVKEVKAIVSKLSSTIEIEQKQIDLPEIQELSAKEIIAEKLNEAKKQGVYPCFCEDVSLEIDCLNGFPGPLIKWFIKSLGTKGVSELVSKYDDASAKASCHIGYYDGVDFHFFAGEVEGSIGEVEGESAFGFDPIFTSKDLDKTFAEMSADEKNSLSHRALAVKELVEFIDKSK